MVVINPIRTNSLRKEPALIRTERIIERHPIILPIPIEEKQKSNEQSIPKSKPGKIEEQIEPEPDSKKDFEIEPKSKKDFEPEPDVSNGPVFDRDGNEGRWRPNDLVRSLVIYRWEFSRWPDDLEDKINHPTGIESYYELRYFREGTNRKGESYADLYKEHRARRDVWIDEECQHRALKDISSLGPPTNESNVVPYRKRSGRSN
jgi:hypothetical protein